MEEKIKKLIEDLENLKDNMDIMFVNPTPSNIIKEAISTIKSLQANCERLENEKAEMGVDFAQWQTEYQEEIKELEEKLHKLQWHVVADEDLPINNTPVLTCKNGYFSILKYKKDTSHWYEMGGNWWWTKNMVDFWMHLSDPCKKGD